MARRRALVPRDIPVVTKAGGRASLDMVSEVHGHLWPSEVAELGYKVDALGRAAFV